MNTPNQWHDDSAELAKMKILVIDDEPVNVALLEDILVENGYTRLESVTDSKLALNTCKNFQPDLILLDLMMPPPDGLAILNSLRTEWDESFLPVVVLTADTNEETKRRALTPSGHWWRRLSSLQSRDSSRLFLWRSQSRLPPAS